MSKFNCASIFLCCILIFSSKINAQGLAYLDSYKYFVGTTEPDSNWKNVDFVDTSWANGAKSIGYGFNTSDYMLDSIVIQPTTSVYLRIPFIAKNISKINLASLLTDFNDGFVAYLNGKEIIRVNLGKAGTVVPYTQTTTKSHLPYENRAYCNPSRSYYIDSLTLATTLIDSNNVLAIQVHNDSINGSNMHFNCGLFNQTGNYYGVYDWETRGVKQVDIDSTPIPIVIINTDVIGFDSCKVRKIAHMKIINHAKLNNNKLTDTIFEYNGRISIKTRGESTASWPKKCYELETQDALGNNLDSSLLGMPAENDWVLFGPFADRSLLRNSLAYDLGRRMGHWAPKTVFCELIINDEHDGLYVLMETVKRDKNRVKVAKLVPTDTSAFDITGGYIFKYDKGSPYIQITYPQEEDITEAQSKYIKQYFDKYLSSTGDSILLHPTKGYRNYIGIDSYIDFTLLCELAKNGDAYLYSTYMHKEKISDGGKIKFGPLWDFDLAFGNTFWQHGDRTIGWQYSDIENIKLYQKRLFKDTALVHQYQARWFALRKTIFNKDSLFNRIDSMIAFLQPAIKRNYEIWPVENKNMDLWYNGTKSFSNSYAEEIPKLKKWLSDRIAWMDANIVKIYYPYNYTVNIAEVQSAISGYEINPNPFEDILTIDYTLRTPTTVTINIYNLYGALMYSEVKQNSNAGQFNETIQLSHLQAGYYLVNIQANGQPVVNEKVLKLK